MSAAEAAGDALDKDFSVWFDENCHVVVKSGLELCSGLGNDFFGGVGHAVCTDEGEAGIVEGLAAGGDVVAFEADDEWQLEMGGLRGCNDAFGDGIAVHDTSENVDEDCFNVGILEDDLECSCHLLR